MVELEQRVRRWLSEIETAGLRRMPRPPEGIDLSSNDYLGLARHPLITERMTEALRTSGCGSTGSRLLRGHREAFAKVERRFAAFKQTESALYFSTGYAANLGVLSAFLEPDDVVFSDERNHASLIDGIRLGRARKVIFPHLDLGELRRRIEAESGARQRFLVTESLFSMDGDQAPLDEYAAICRETGTALIVDEAHAVGIYGETGSGLIEAAGIGDSVFLSVNTAGKALGVAGAFVAGPGWAIEYLVHRARSFVFSTAPPPSLAEAIDAALTLIRDEPQRRRRLLSLARLVRQELGLAGIAVPGGDSPIIPVILGDSKRALEVARALVSGGFDVRAIRPPTVPEGTARLRISMNTHFEEDLLPRFTSTLAKAISETAPCSAASL